MKIVLCLWREGGGDPCQPQALLVVALPAGGPGGQLAVVAGHPIYRFIGPRQQPDLHNIIDGMGDKLMHDASSNINGKFMERPIYD